MFLKSFILFLFVVHSNASLASKCSDYEKIDCLECCTEIYKSLNEFKKNDNGVVKFCAELERGDKGKIRKDIARKIDYRNVGAPGIVASMIDSKFFDSFADLLCRKSSSSEKECLKSCAKKRHSHE